MTNIVYDPKSRFQVSERPTSHPGKCRCCGSADRRVVDMGADDEEGVIYLCEICVVEAAMRFGTVVPETKYLELSVKYKELQRTSEKAGEYANELLTDVTLATSRFFDRIRGLADPEVTETSEPDSEESGNSDNEDPGTPERSDNKDNKPASKSRSPRLSAAPSDSSVFKPTE